MPLLTSGALENRLKYWQADINHLIKGASSSSTAYLPYFVMYIYSSKDKKRKLKLEHISYSTKYAIHTDRNYRMYCYLTEKY